MAYTEVNFINIEQMCKVSVKTDPKEFRSVTKIGAVL
jgi:hypothetical protein